MGKRRSNQNRRKKNGRKGLQNPCAEKKADSVVDQEVKREKYGKNCGSSGPQKELSNIRLSNQNSVTSCKTVAPTLGFNPSENNRSNTLEEHKSLNTGGTKMKLLVHENKPSNLNAADLSLPHTSHNTKSNNLSGEIDSTSINKSENGNQCLSFVDKHQVRAVPEFQNEMPEAALIEEFPIRYTPQYSCVSESDEDYPISYVSEEKSLVDGRIKSYSGFQDCPKEHDDRVTFYRCMNEESSETEDEYSTSDFFKPVFDDFYENKSKVSQAKYFSGACDENSHWTNNTYSAKPSFSGVKNSAEKSAFEEKKLKETISYSVDAYRNSKDYFSDVYHMWLQERRNTLQKLKTLLAEVHKDQLNYNKSQEAFRELGFASRTAKNPDNQVVNFFASFTAFLSDAASGMVSVAQAFNVDSYQSKFKEIMENDAEITQRLYKARSQCVTNYQDIDEVMRKFHSDNFSTTIGKISDTLEVGKYWEGMKKAYQKDDMPQLLDMVSKFFDNALQSRKLEEVSGSIQTYVNDNPAAVDACTYAGSAAYGALDTWAIKGSQNKVLRGIDVSANNLLMVRDKLEIQRLRSTIEEDAHQSKIETQIEEAIDSLESELSEINDLYFELFKSHSDSDDSDCDIYAFY